MATIGTPEDAIATITALAERTGGFGCVLLLAHDCADPEAQRRSFRLFADEVAPVLRSASLGARDTSRRWIMERSGELLGPMSAAISAAVAKYSDPGPQASVGTWLPERHD